MIESELARKTPEEVEPERPSMLSSTSWAAEDRNEEEIVNYTVKEALRKGTLHPHSQFKKGWDIITSFLLIYVAIVVPVRVGFELTSYGNWFAWEIVIDGWFVLDLVLNFFTAFYRDDFTLSVVHTEIAWRYAQGWMLIDAVSCIPTDVILRANAGALWCSMESESSCIDNGTPITPSKSSLVKLLKILRLAKLFRLTKIGKMAAVYQDDFFKILPLLAVLRLIVILLYLGHLFGCFFYFFSADPSYRTANETKLIDAGIIDSWTDQYERYLKDLYDTDGEMDDSKYKTDMYIASIYWAFTTMTTVGYGDISAFTRMERVFAVIGMIAGGFVFSLIIGTMADVVAMAKGSERAHQERMDLVLNFTVENPVRPDNAISLLRFFRMQRTYQYNQQQLLLQVPFDLRIKLVMDIYAPVIATNTFFLDKSDVFVVEVCALISNRHYVKDSMVYRQGELGRHFYLVERGKLEVVSLTNTAVFFISQGSFFGEGALLHALEIRAFNIRCKTDVELCEISAKDLEPVLIAFPEVKEELRATWEERKATYASVVVDRRSGKMTRKASTKNISMRDQLMDYKPSVRQMILKDKKGLKSQMEFSESLDNDERHMPTIDKSKSEADPTKVTLKCCSDHGLQGSQTKTDISPWCESSTDSLTVGEKIHRLEEQLKEMHRSQQAFQTEIRELLQPLSCLPGQL